MIAFWEYDRFPYTIGGEVVGELRTRGRVETKEYGKGTTFDPIKLLPDVEGQSLLTGLRELRVEHWKAQKKLDAEFHRRVRKLLDAAGVPHNHVPKD